MDDRSANAMKRVDPFAATDALLSAGAPGESLFVINLCAANMPQAIDASSVRAWGIQGLEAYKLYQVSRLEDGRTRYRVRLGFFTTEADAEVVLRSIRGKFATAFTSGLGDEDLKHASGYLKKPLHEIQEIQDIQRTGRYRIPKFAAEDLPPDTDSTATRQQPALKATPTMARAVSALLDSSPTIPGSAVAKPTAINSGSVQGTNKSPPKNSAVQSAKKAEVVEFEWIPDQTASKNAAESSPAVKRIEKPVSVPAKPSAKPTAIKSSTAKEIAPDAKSVASAKATTVPANTPVAAKHPTSVPTTRATTRPEKLEIATRAPAAISTPSPVKPNAPFHVGAGRSIPDNGLSLATEAPAPAAAKPAIAAPANLPRPLVSAAALSKLRAAAIQPRNSSSDIPTLDTTQTIRTLTKTEIEDANAPKWFVVQLAISDQPANLDTMPRLDIFEAYRLYSVATMENNIIRHALRLGFFSEKVSAEAVMGYVKTFFGEPTIEQISDAEQKRFGESFALTPATALADAVKPQARVITLEEKRPQPIPIATATPTKPRADANKTAGRLSMPATKRSAPLATKKNSSGRSAHGKVSQADLNEARLLGLSETAIRRVERNPSLLSRLVDKLTK